MLALASGARAYADGPEGKVNFNLASDEFPKAILEFYHQSKIEVLFLANDSLSLIHTQAVVGEFEPGEALERMLKGTGLTFKFATEHSVTIKQPVVAEASPLLTRPPPATPAVLKAPGPLHTVAIIAERLQPTSEVVVAAGAETITLTRPDIDIAGAQTATAAVSAIPQNWHGGANEDTYLGPEAQQNADKASGVNLRGLNDSATSVYWNGHKLAPSGTLGAYIDISSIPVAAIEKIQAMPDSISITQGGDSIGGMVNFVTKHNYQGSETDVSYGHVSSGPMGELRVAQLEGTQWDAGRGFLALEYYDRGDLPMSYRARATSDLTPWGGGNFDTTACSPGSIVGTTYQHLCNLWRGADLLPRQRHYSAVGTLDFAIDDIAILSFDALATRREVTDEDQETGYTLLVPASNPWIPTGLTGPLLVNHNFANALGQHNWSTGTSTGNVASSINIDLGNKWSATAQSGWGIETYGQTGRNVPNMSLLEQDLASANPTTAYDPFANPTRTSSTTINAIRSESHYDSDSQVRWANAKLNGALFRAPGGDASLAVGGEYTALILNTHSMLPGEAVDTTDLSRHVRSGFLEIQLPISGKDAASGRIDASAGIRVDDYSDAGAVWLPQFTMRWLPVDALSIKGSWQRAARAPDLGQLNERGNISAFFSLADGASVQRNILALAGGNASLRPEMADSWTLEIEAQPVGGLSLGGTFFDTHYANKVAPTQFELNILQDPRLAYAVIRNPSAQLRGVACQLDVFVGGSTDSCLTTPIYALIDLRQHNIAKSWTDGIDWYLRYAVPGFGGQWDIGIIGTYVFDYKEQQLDSDPIQLVNTQNEPLALRARGYATWKRSGWEASGTVNFSGAYTDVASVPNRHVSSWTTVDLRLSYEPVSRFQVALNVQNVGNSMSPFLNNSAAGIGYDQENGNLVGRLWTVQTRLRW